MIGAVSRTRGYFTAAGVALALGLAACSGSDADPEPAPPPTSSSPSPADGPAAPTMPPAARGTDAASAEAFVRFYWEMVNHAQETGDVTQLEGLASKCINCAHGVAFIEKVYQRDGVIRGGRAGVSNLVSRFIQRDGELWAVVDGAIDLTEQTVDYPGTNRDQHYDGGVVKIRLYLQPTADAWIVRALAEL